MSEPQKSVFDQEIERGAFQNAISSGLRGGAPLERLEAALDAFADKIVADYKAEAEAALAKSKEKGSQEDEEEEPLFRDVNEPVGLLDLGYDYQGEGQYVRALALYRRFLRETEGRAGLMDRDRRGFVRENFVKSLLKIAEGGDPHVAIRACDWAIRFDPGAREAYLARWKGYAALGRKDEAKASLQGLARGKLWGGALLGIALAAALSAGAYWFLTLRLGQEWTPARIGSLAAAGLLIWGATLYRLKTTLALLLR